MEEERGEKGGFLIFGLLRKVGSVHTIKRKYDYLRLKVSESYTYSVEVPSSHILRSHAHSLSFRDIRSTPAICEKHRLQVGLG